MLNAFRNRSIFFQLLVGGMAILVFFVVSAGIVYVHFMNELATADGRRWAATEIALHLQEARQYEGEGDYTSQGSYQRQFYETGNSPIVQQHRQAIAQLNQAIDTLASWHGDRWQTIDAQLRDAVKAYVTTFDTMSQIYREEGNGAFGVEGAWRAVADTIQERARSAGEPIATYADRLIGAQRNYLLDNDARSAGAVHAANASLANSSTKLPALATLARRSDSLFQLYLDLRAQAGETEHDGLQRQLLNDAHKVQDLAGAVLDDATQEDRLTHQRLALSIPLVCLLDLGLAALFFWLFAASISRAVTTLGEAAAAIGNGEFTKRVHLEFRNELGQLGDVFNRMAEDLAALMSSVQHSGLQINSSAMEIAATARQQQATASEIASTTAKVGETAHGISARSQELANTMKQVASGAERTATLAGTGQTGIARMESTMRQISAASDSISARLSTLSEKAGNINTVVTTITKVADQTNLLSLNAAIEAEKAGEAGRGFSVVATEIRRLADQTAAATSDIEQIVKEMQSAVTAGVMGMDKFSDEVRRGVDASGQVGEQLSEIIHQVQTLTPNFEVVNVGMQSQAEGAQQISEALSQLGAAARQTAESLVQSNQAINQLNDASHTLQAGVSRFTVGN